MEMKICQELPERIAELKIHLIWNRYTLQFYLGPEKTAILELRLHKPQKRVCRALPEHDCNFFRRQFLPLKTAQCGQQKKADLMGNQNVIP